MKKPPTNWRSELAGSWVDPGKLGLSQKATRRIQRVARVFPMRIPPHLVSLMDPRNPRCPIRRQVVPDERELREGGTPDPLNEESFQLEPGVICRFPDRLLALVSRRCPVFCRHCSRKRNWRGPSPAAGPEEIARALTRRPEVREVILSGGEPLLLPNRNLHRLLQAARSSPRVEVVRIHSRIPGSLPSRITAGLVRTLRRHRPLWFITHFNHARELSAAARAALGRLGDAGLPLLNQAVLLRGVNDSVAAQAELGRSLVAAGVKPHYLFLLDRATGTGHFQVSIQRAAELIYRLRTSYSGLLTPHLLLDLPGKYGKVPITPSAVVKIDRRGAWLRGKDGRQIRQLVTIDPPHRG